jgi:hypothetical protein
MVEAIASSALLLRGEDVVASGQEATTVGAGVRHEAAILN